VLVLLDNNKVFGDSFKDVINDHDGIPVSFISASETLPQLTGYETLILKFPVLGSFYNTPCSNPSLYDILIFSSSNSLLSPDIRE
jgi:hypothetical protein